MPQSWSFLRPWIFPIELDGAAPAILPKQHSSK
jgi:hypothetical protein